MRKYEAMVIFYPNLEEEKRNALLERFKKIIEAGGTVTTVDEWGMRKLAYLIDDLAEGYYVLIKFESGADVVNEFDRIAKISDGVMRHMITRDEE
ncbi:MAG: 30S ribosomal protein S6 [Bacillota bacterium]